MQHYWFHAIPFEKCDKTIQDTFNYYVGKYNKKSTNGIHNGIHSVDFAPDCLKPVRGGDTIFICAHGHEKQNFISKRPDQTSGDGTLSITQLAELLQKSGLNNSVGSPPIWIKLLVCWAGGPTLTLKQLDDFFERFDKSHKTERYSPKWRHHTLRNYVQKLPGDPDKEEVVFAKGLAIKLQKMRIHGVCVGGYFGKLIADNTRKTVEVLQFENYPLQISAVHAAVYYNGDGEFVQRAKDDNRIDSYKLRKY